MTTRWGRCPLLGALGLLAAMTTSLEAQHGTTDGQWPVHGGDTGFTRYAPLDQVNGDNVRRPAHRMAATGR